MKPTPEIESAAKEFADQWWKDGGMRADLAPDLAHFLAKLIAQERAKVWEEARDTAFNTKPPEKFTRGRGPYGGWLSGVYQFRDIFHDRAAASRKEAEGE